MRLHTTHITPLSDIYHGRQTPYPTFYNRIEKTQKTGLINMIIIDGKSQTGKSTLARSICKTYDPDYKTIFTVKELVQYLSSRKETHVVGDYSKYRWLFFDEVELESARSDWWSERNKVLQAIVSSFGFLRINIIMTCPNIKGLSDVLLTNISMRISIVTDLGKNNEIVRKAYIKKAIYSEMKNKFIWITVQDHRIPLIEKDDDYERVKANNFFNVQLVKWADQLKTKTKPQYKVDNYGNLITYQQ